MLDLDGGGGLCVYVNVQAFISLMNTGGIFSKVTQQQGANYFFFCLKLVKDHSAPVPQKEAWPPE